MTDDPKDDKTPLQRYLSKQRSEQRSEQKAQDEPNRRDRLKAEKAALENAAEPPPRESVPTQSETFWKSKEGAQSSAGPRDEELAAPHKQLPPPPPPPAMDSAPVAVGKAGGLFSRFLALMIDSIIVWGISMPIRGALAFIFWFFPSYDPSLNIVAGMSLSTFIAVQIVTYFYYGWFYKERGASPGKMLFGLEVVRVSDGKRLDYTTAYLRESIGKYISGLVLAIGYLIALFRTDRRALHDLIFATEVVKARTEK